MSNFLQWFRFISTVIFSSQARKDLIMIFDDWRNIPEPLAAAPTVDPEWQRKHYAEMGIEDLY